MTLVSSAIAVTPPTSTPASEPELFSPLARHLGDALENYSAQERELAQRFLRDMIEATTAAREDIPPA